jgi:hypothetical protein
MITRLVLDRIEGDRAVLEFDGRAVELPLALLPSDVEEGDVLTMAVHRDEETTREAKAGLAARRARLSRDDDGGDFSL